MIVRFKADSASPENVPVKTIACAAIERRVDVHRSAVYISASRNSERGLWPMTSIFDRIFWYRQSDRRTPEEDYFTEILAAILKKHQALAAAFIGYLSDHGDIERVDIQTQKLFSCFGCQPDIYVTAYDSTGRRHALIMENKIDAPEGEYQLFRYMKLMEQEERDADSRTLVYITQYSGSDFVGESNHVKFNHIHWYQVYGFIKKWMKNFDNKKENSRELITELLNLMEDWKMDGELTAKDLRAAVIYHTSLHNGKSLMAITDQAWEKSGIEKFLRETTGKWSYYNYWQYSPKLAHFGVQIGMGYWFDRKDSIWDVERLELPSAAVVLYQRINPPPAELKRPSGAWTEDREESIDGKSLWVKKLDEIPCYGTSLSEFYREFFLKAFKEIKGALKRT